MEDIFKPSSLTIKQLFGNTDALYQIPRYQRAYSWGDNELDKLWDDIIEAKQNDPNYFLGSIITAKPEESSSYLDIVDGQQRSFALQRTKNTEIMVPIVGFIAPDVSLQREQFVLVNKAKPLPKRLINELLPEIGTELPSDLRPSKIPSELCNTLNNDPQSPFYGLIRRISTESMNPQAVITDTALINLMKLSINNFGALALFKNTGKGDTDIESMYKTMCIFWSAVKVVFPEAWGKTPQESRLMHSAGIQAMGILMDRIMPRLYQEKDIKSEVIKTLKRIAPECCWIEGTWQGLDLKWNDIQNISKHIKGLAELLVQLDFEASIQAK